MVIGGGSIFLIALGAILSFAVNDQQIGPLDLNVVGWILMLAGLVGFIITLWTWNSRRTRVVAAPPAQTDYVVRPTDGTTVEEQRYTQRRY